jgi:hypothetical protein
MCGFAASLALLRPSAAAAEALTLAEEREDFTEAEDTIFKIWKLVLRRYWVLWVKNRVGSRNEDRARGF